MSFPLNNLLLESLPERVFADLIGHMERVDLPVRSSLFKLHEAPRHVHFLLSGIASVITTMRGGEAVEVGIIGHEGLPEKVHLLGPQRGETECFMQMPGTALRMGFKQFQSRFLNDPDLQEAVHRYIQHDNLVLAQLAACNRLHEVESRLARWLLMVTDRTGEPELQLTQEFLGEMLGTRRSSVNLAASGLQRSGLVSYSRGRILIQDRPGLEDAACECYGSIQRLYFQLYK